MADPDFDLRSEPLAALENGEMDNVAERRSRDLDRWTLHFDRLAGTRVEGIQIANQLGVSPLLDQAAVVTAIKTCRSPRVLHIATHGFFLPVRRRVPRTDYYDMLHILEIPGYGSYILDKKLAFDEEHIENEVEWLVGVENPLLRSGLALAGANIRQEGKVLPCEAGDGILTG